MYCAYCSEKIHGDAIKRAGDLFCSMECANLAAGIDPDEPGVEDFGDFDEDFLEEELI